jgi:hypothetical protein
LFLLTLSGTASGPVGSSFQVRCNLFYTGDWQLTVSGWTENGPMENSGIRQEGDPASTTFTCAFSFDAFTPYTYDGADVWLVTVGGYLVASDSTGSFECV